MRFSCLFAVLLCGCQPAADYSDLYSDLACEAAYSIVRLRSEIAPTPAPPASDKCENCDGTGKIGDGRIVMTCPVCKGTGKKLKSVLVRPDCQDGKCRP